MIRKFKTIEEGISMLEQLDAELAPRVRAEDMTKQEYQQLLAKLNQRQSIIAHMNNLRKGKPLEDSASVNKIKQIYQNNQKIMAKIAEKQNQILKRLRDRQKSVQKNKNFPY